MATSPSEIRLNRRFNDAIEVRYAALEEVCQGLADGTISFGEAIRQLRTGVTGLSQSDFARACKLSLRTVRLLEQDEGNPTVATLNSIFKLFGMRVGVVRVRRAPIKLSD